MNCIKCGEPVGEGFKFCMKCGTPVGSQPAPGPEASAPSVAPVEINPTAPEKPSMPYYQPVMQGGNIGNKLSNQFQIIVSPEYFNFAFKFNLVYHGPWTYPGRGIPMEFTQCAPEEIPDI